MGRVRVGWDRPSGLPLGASAAVLPEPPLALPGPVLPQVCKNSSGSRGNDIAVRIVGTDFVERFPHTSISAANFPIMPIL